MFYKVCKKLHIVIFLFLLSCFNNNSLNPKWVPLSTKLVKDSTFWGNQTYLISKYHYNDYIDTLKIKDFPILNNKRSDIKLIHWRKYNQLKNHDKIIINGILKFQNLDFLEKVNSGQYYSAIYLKQDNFVYYVGILDIKKNKLCIIEWIK